MKNTLSKIAAGVGALTLVVSLSACAGDPNQSACKAAEDSLKSAGFDLNSAASVGTDMSKLKTMGDVLVKAAGDNSGADISAAFKTVGEYFQGAATAATDPSKAAELQAKTADFTAATKKISETCKS